MIGKLYANAMSTCLDITRRRLASLKTYTHANMVNCIFNCHGGQTIQDWQIWWTNSFHKWRPNTDSHISLRHTAKKSACSVRVLVSGPKWMQNDTFVCFKIHDSTVSTISKNKVKLHRTNKSLPEIIERLSSSCLDSKDYLDSDAFRYRRLAVNLMNLGVTATQIHRHNLLVDFLQTSENTVTF